MSDVEDLDWGEAFLDKSESESRLSQASDVRRRRAVVTYLSLRVHSQVLQFAVANNLADEGEALAVIAYQFFQTEQALAEALAPDNTGGTC
jgi:hypothetical protein